MILLMHKKSIMLLLVAGSLLLINHVAAIAKYVKDPVTGVLKKNPDYLANKSEAVSKPEAITQPDVPSVNLSPHERALCLICVTGAAHGHCHKL